MMRMKNLAAGLGLAFSMASGSAFAGGYHQICYQGPSTSTGALTAIFGCRADNPNLTCSVGLSGGTAIFGPAGLLKQVTLPSSGSFNTAMTFSDGTTRSCTVSAIANGGVQTPLVGYTTDLSGLVMTGVWTQRSNQFTSPVRQVIAVPGDFVVVGGGVVGNEGPPGALVGLSLPTGDLDKREWWVGTQDDIYPEPHDNDAYAIGLKIEGLGIASLRPLISTTLGGSAPNAWVSSPTATAPMANGTVPLGGGVHGRGPLGSGQYLTQSFPNLMQNFCYPACEQTYTITGWTGTSKDHGVSVPGEMDAYLIAITGQFSVGSSTWHVVTSVSTATSAEAAHPSIVVAGTPGEYALTSIGAYVDWQDYGSFGNLIWKLLPRPDIAGAEVASKDHGFVSPATITGYAIGVKLVPGPFPTAQPPPIILRPPPIRRP
jgi:hypothetical protein